MVFSFHIAHFIIDYKVIEKEIILIIIDATIVTMNT
jgi:hypothetical protein